MAKKAIQTPRSAPIPLHGLVQPFDRMLLSCDWLCRVESHKICSAQRIHVHLCVYGSLYCIAS